MPNNNIAILILPRGELGLKILESLRVWRDVGIISDALYIHAEELEMDRIQNYDVSAKWLTDLENERGQNLFQCLGEESFSQKDLLIPWFVGDGPPDAEMAHAGYKLQMQIESTRSLAKGETKRDNNFFSSLVAIPSYQIEDPKPLYSNTLDYSVFHANIYISPEMKIVPGGAAIPFKENQPSFHAHVAAQLVTVGGLWAGVKYPLSKILSGKNFSFGDNVDKVIVMRSSAAAVIASGLASKIISTSLERVIDPSQNPFDETSGIDGRPVSIKNDPDLVRGPIEDYKNEIISLAKTTTQSDLGNQSSPLRKSTSMEYFPQPKPTDIDFERELQVGFRDFVTWVKQTIAFMPKYSWAWVQNTFATLMGKILRDIKLPVPEYKSNLDKDAAAKLAEINEMITNPDSEENRSIRELAFQPDSYFFTELRRIIFESLDTGRVKEKNGKYIVLPSVDAVAADPSARFAVSKDVADEMGIPMELDFDTATEIRAKAYSKIAFLESTETELKLKLEALRKESDRQEDVDRQVAANEAEAEKILLESAVEDLDEPNQKESLLEGRASDKNEIVLPTFIEDQPASNIHPELEFQETPNSQDSSSSDVYGVESDLKQNNAKVEELEAQEHLLDEKPVFVEPSEVDSQDNSSQEKPAPEKRAEVDLLKLLQWDESE